MAKVFISYSSRDRDIVKRIAEDVRNAGHEVWFDRWKITGRQPYWDEIQTGIEECTHFVFFVSPESISKGSGARKELFHVASLKPPPTLVPVMVDQTPFEDFPIVISPGEYQIHDFVNLPYEDGLGSVLRALDPQRSRLLQPITRSKRPEEDSAPVIPSPVPASAASKTTKLSTPTQALPTAPASPAAPAPGGNRALLPILIGVGVVAVGVIGALIALQGGGNATATVAPTAVAQRATETPDVTATFTLTLSAEDIAATQRSSRRTQTAVALEATSAQQTIDAIINLKDQSDTATAIALTPITATPTASLTPTFTETPVPTATPTASLTPMESPTEQPTTAVAVVSTPESQPLAAGAFGSSGRAMVAYDTYFQLATLASQTQTAIQLAEVGRFAQYQNLRSRISYGAWSPTGSRFVFTSNRSGLWELYMLNADGSNLQKLTFLDSDVAQVGQPCAGFTWSPKGDQIIFTAKDNFMYLLEVASKRARDYGPMTRANLRRIACPAWSPDGNFIYFQSLVSGRTSIGRLEVNSGRVTSTLGEIIPNASELAPSVSPLNDLVAYTLVVDGAWQLSLMQADGSAKRRLYSNEEGQAFPIGWTLDGKAVLFALQHPEDAPRVYMINVDGSGLRLLAENAFAAYLEPRPQP